MGLVYTYKTSIFRGSTGRHFKQYVCSQAARYTIPNPKMELRGLTCTYLRVWYVRGLVAYRWLGHAGGAGEDWRPIGG